MKAILLSVKPQHLANILNGKKTIELRKSKLPLNVPVYLYCTKTIPYLYKGPYKTMHSLDRTNPFNYIWYLNNKKMNIDLQSGKVVAKCMFSEVKELKWGRWVGQEIFSYRGWNYEHDELLTKTCLTNEQLQNYGDNKKIYLHHISNLEIFDTPKELSEFNRRDGFIDMGVNCKYRPLTKAPQSWCYVEVEE